MKKRWLALILIIYMLFSITGCGKTGKEKQSEEFSEMVTEPENNIKMEIVEWNQKFRYDHGNIVTFNINSKVEIPDTNELNMYHVKANSIYDTEYKKNLLNYFKEDGEAYYADIRYTSPDIIETYINSMEQLYKNALEDEQCLKNTQFKTVAELKTLMEEYYNYLDYSGDGFRFVKVYSYDCDYYYIKKNDTLYVFNNDYYPDVEKNIFAVAQNNLIKFAPEQLKNCENVDIQTDYFNLAKESVDKELVLQDRKLAETVIGRMGYDFMSYDSSIRMCWTGSGNFVYEGDRLSYKAAIDGRKIFEAQPISRNKARCFRQPEFTLYIYNGELLRFDKCNSLNFYESESSEKVQILDFEKIKKAFENEIEENWELYYEDTYSGINIYDVRRISLEYVFLPNEDGDEGYLVPCYMFLYHNTNYSGTNYDDIYIAINAIDGSVIYP